MCIRDRVHGDCAVFSSAFRSCLNERVTTLPELKHCGNVGSYYNQEKWLKDDKASEKLIETTAKSSFTSFLATGASFLGREAAKQATNSRPVPRHIKIGRTTFLKVYCSGRAASRKTPGSSLLSIFPGKCRTFRKCIE